MLLYTIPLFRCLMVKCHISDRQLILQNQLMLLPVHYAALLAHLPPLLAHLASFFNSAMRHTPRCLGRIGQLFLHVHSIHSFCRHTLMYLKSILAQRNTSDDYFGCLDRRRMPPNIQHCLILLEYRFLDRHLVRSWALYSCL